jgi:exonuclease SbcD
MKLAHLADIHLGHRQYGLKQREDDMASTFNGTLRRIATEDPAAVLLPGDLFHSRTLRPKVLDNTEQILSDNIPDDVPVLVSRGNHDDNLTPRDVTWLNYLHRRERIVLLEADLDADSETAQFTPYDLDNPGTSAGYYDIESDAGTVRVFGLQWRGARVDTALEQVARGIRDTNDDAGEPIYTILLAHFGMEDEVPSLGGTVTHAELSSVQEVVDYVALGHIHKRYDAADWIYNPGSPEAHSTREAQNGWDHGYYLIDLSTPAATTSEGPGHLSHTVVHEYSPRRPFYTVEFDVTPHESRNELETAFREQVQNEHVALEQYCEQPQFTNQGQRRQPLINLRFTGTLQFDRADLRTDELAVWTTDDCDALYVQTNTGIRTADVQALLAELDETDVFVDGRLNTAALERQVFETIATESRYAEHADAVTDVLERSHHMAQDGESVEDICDLISTQRRDLFPELTADVEIDVPVNPFADGDETSTQASATEALTVTPAAGEEVDE